MNERYPAPLATAPKDDMLMPSSHVTAVQDIVDGMIREGDPETPFLLEVAGRMNDGFYPSWLMDSVSQKHRGRFDHYDAYSFLRILEHLYTGELLCGSIKVGEGPGSDKSVELNNAILSRLAGKYAATFRGKCGDDDGEFAWSEPISLHAVVLNCDDDTEAKSRIAVPPQTIPLEVGTTAASRTLIHIRMDGGLARWPYDSDELHVFVLRKDVFQAFQNRRGA